MSLEYNFVIMLFVILISEIPTYQLIFIFIYILAITRDFANVTK